MALTELPALPAGTAARSPLHERVLFLLAPAGSGAEVVDAALRAVRGCVGAGVPSRLFDQGLGEVLNNFALGATPGATGPGAVGTTGLSALAGPEEVVTALRELGDTVYARLGADPADVVVDYSPGHARWAMFVAAIYPDATFVHVLRDISTVAAAADDPTAAATEWLDSTRWLREAPLLDRMHRVRADELAADPDRLAGLLAAAGITADAAPGIDVVRRRAAELAGTGGAAGLDPETVRSARELAVDLGYPAEAVAS